MKKRVPMLLIIFITCLGMTVAFEGYDIMIIAGQSNNMLGVGKNPSIDVGADNIYQLGRLSVENREKGGGGLVADMEIIPVTEPLHNHDYKDWPNYIGYGLALARRLKTIGYGTEQRPLLIIPAANFGTTNSEFDLNDDGNVNIIDLIIIGKEI